jgi:phage shock protein E
MRTPNVRLAAAPLLAVVLLAGGCSSEADEVGAGEAAVSEAFPAVNGAAVPVEQFAAHVDDDGTTVVDVRTPEEFASGHIDGAINIELGSPGFDDLLEQMDRDATYAVYCQSDNRSGQAVQRMVEAGLTSVYHLDGGIVAWVESGREVVTP